MNWRLLGVAICLFVLKPDTVLAQCAPATPNGVPPSSGVKSICFSSASQTISGALIDAALASWRNNCPQANTGFPPLVGPGGGGVCGTGSIYVEVTFNPNPYLLNPNYDATTKLLPGNGAPITGALITCYVNPCSEKLLAHEIGHSLGRGDTNNSACLSAIMYQGGAGSRTDFSEACGQISTTWTTTAEALANCTLSCWTTCSGTPPTCPLQPPPPPPPPDPTVCHNCGGTNPEPLVLDLDGNGIATSGISQPVSFDLDGDGKEDAITWLAQGTQDGFLWVDLDPNMKVDGGQELFGIGTMLPDGSKAHDGFEALSAYDSIVWGGNGDSKISATDAVWARLRLWVDGNHDGISQVVEISSIHEYGVVEIYLEHTVDLSPDAQGNLHLLKGHFLRRVTGDGAARHELRDVEGIAFQFLR